MSSSSSSQYLSVNSIPHNNNSTTTDTTPFSPSPIHTLVPSLGKSAAVGTIGGAAGDTDYNGKKMMRRRRRIGGGGGNNKRKNSSASSSSHHSSHHHHTTMQQQKNQMTSSSSSPSSTSHSTFQNHHHHHYSILSHNHDVSIRPSVHQLPDTLPNNTNTIPPTTSRTLPTNNSTRYHHHHIIKSPQPQIYHSLASYDRFILCGGRNGFSILRSKMEPMGFRVTEWKRVCVWKDYDYVASSSSQMPLASSTNSLNTPINTPKMIRHMQWNQNGIVGCGENGVWRMNVDLEMVDDDDTEDWFQEHQREEYINLCGNPHQSSSSHASSISQQSQSHGIPNSHALTWYDVKSANGTRSSATRKLFRHLDLSASRILSLEENRLHVWDWQNTNDSLISLKGSNSQLITSKWYPHSSVDGTLLALGAENGAVKILDLRATSQESINLVTWKRDRAHDESVRAIAWNPFVPHWLASASNSGNTHLWDLRYQRDPVVRLEGHDNVVRTLSWSATHCELLASGGADQQVRIWSLRQEPHYQLTSIQSNFISPVIGVEHSARRNRQMYALSALGSLNCFNITPAFLKPLVVSRYPEKAEREHNIEMKLFNRQFKSAFNDIISVAREMKNNNQVEKALSLLDLCKTRDLSTPITDKNPEIRFRKELEEYSYYLPPNMKSKEYDRAWKMKKDEINNLIWNLEILLYVKNMDIRRIEQLKGKIFELLQGDLDRLEVSTLRDVAQLYLNHNYGAGIDFIVDISRLFQKRNQFSQLEPICTMIVGAHVYDTHQNPSLAEESFEMSTELIRDAEFMLTQFELHKRMICALWDPNDSGQTIIDLVDKSTIEGEATHLRIFSLGLIRLYLNALLGKDELGRFVIVTTELLDKYRGYDIEFLLLAMLKDIAMPRFAEMESQQLLDFDEDEDPIRYLSSTQNITVIVLSIAKYSAFLPDFMQQSVKSALSFMRDTLEECLETIHADRHYASLQNSVGEILRSTLEQVEASKSKGVQYERTESMSTPSTPLQKLRSSSTDSASTQRHRRSDPVTKSIRDAADLLISLMEQNSQS